MSHLFAVPQLAKLSIKVHFNFNNLNESVACDFLPVNTAHSETHRRALGVQGIRFPLGALCLSSVKIASCY